MGQGHPGRHNNPVKAGPIVCRLMGLPVAAGCDTAQDRTWICNDASKTVPFGRTIFSCFDPVVNSNHSQTDLINK